MEVKYVNNEHELDKITLRYKDKESYFYIAGLRHVEVDLVKSLLDTLTVELSQLEVAVDKRPGPDAQWPAFSCRGGLSASSM